MSEDSDSPFQYWPKIPYVGVGCIVEHNDRLLLVRDRRGLWATPGGHLDYGESPISCAARETKEETGIVVRNIDFVAVTNDVLDDVGKHYVTIWMRGEPDSNSATIGDTSEIAEVGWFSPDDMPGALHKFFVNLVAGHCMPQSPANFPRALIRMRDARHFSYRCEHR